MLSALGGGWDGDVVKAVSQAGGWEVGLRETDHPALALLTASPLGGPLARGRATEHADMCLGPWLLVKEQWWLGLEQEACLLWRMLLLRGGKAVTS